MSPSHADPTWSRTSPRGLGLAAVGSALALALLVAMAAFPVPAQAATPAIGLGTADNFAVLAGSGITNTGPTTITGDVGSYPTQTQIGFNSVTLTGTSTNHGGNAVTQQAKDDLVVAYDEAAGGSATEIDSDLGGQTLVPGVYSSADGTFGNTGVLILDGGNETDPVFVFQTIETLITDSGSSVVLIGNADACNVYWQIGSSATLGTSSSLVGTIMALTSITLTTGAKVDGRVLARNGAVTMDTNTITRTACTEPESTATVVESSNATTATGEPVTLTATVTADDASTPTGDVEFFDGDTSLGVVPLAGDGTAELTTTGLGAGTRTITAVYLGAPGHGSSTSDGLTQTVQGAGAPTAPALPSEPTPAVPSAPTAPAVPSAPTPAAPSAPAAPVAPAAPAAPSAPTAPAVPSAPTEPAAPSAPTAPGVPTSPPAPVTPGVPQFAG